VIFPARVSLARGYLLRQLHALADIGETEASPALRVDALGHERVRPKTLAKDRKHVKAHGASVF